MRRLRVSEDGRELAFPEVADAVGALLLCDMAHFAGLVAAGLHLNNPAGTATSSPLTTHKTLAGPRSGFVLCREEHAQAVDRAVFPGMQGGLAEPRDRGEGGQFQDRGVGAFREYQSARANADALAESLQDGGLDVLTGGTDTHLLLVDLRRTNGAARTPRSGSLRSGSR